MQSWDFTHAEYMAAIRRVWYEDAAPSMPIRRRIMDSVVRDKSWLLQDEEFRDLVRQGGDFVLVLLEGGYKAEEDMDDISLYF